MSPKQRYQAPKTRDRRELLKAVLAVVVVVGATAIVIWLLRPSPDDRFDGGGGGLLNRQPRAGWLVALSVIALVAFVWWVFSRPRRQRTRLLAIGAVMILIIACITGFFWPGGLLRTYVAPPDPTDFPELTPSTLPTTETTGAPPDTSTPDTSTPDTGTPDTSTVDTGTPETGSP